MNKPEKPGSNSEPIIRRYSLIRAERLKAGNTLGQRIVLAYRHSFPKRTANQSQMETPTDASASAEVQSIFDTVAPEQVIANPNTPPKVPQEND